MLNSACTLWSVRLGRITVVIEIVEGPALFTRSKGPSLYVLLLAQRPYPFSEGFAVAEGVVGSLKEFPCRSSLLAHTTVVPSCRRRLFAIDIEGQSMILIEIEIRWLVEAVQINVL